MEIAYFSGVKVILSMTKTHYFEQVYAVTKAIPGGRVCTYGLIADYLALGSARMVGWALHQSISMGANVPAHRVVNAKGELSGKMHFNPPGLMQTLLEQEGLNVKNDRVENFQQVLWIPAEQLPEAEQWLPNNI